MKEFTAQEMESMTRAIVVAWDADEAGVCIRGSDGSSRWRSVHRGYAMRQSYYGHQERIEFTFCGGEVEGQLLYLMSE